MTDKQMNHEQSSVIIDGIDVSRCTCRYYAYNRHLCSLIGDDLCEEHSDCLYKQLKRKEQECEELKKQIKYEFDETLLQYSNTIEDLQKQLKDSVMQKCPQCGETYLNPIGSKLYEALIEIKELVQSDYCTEIGSCEFCAEIGNCLNRKILHKISEVIDE